MGSVSCTRCGDVSEALEAAPFKSPLGEEVRASVCRECWAACQELLAKILNEYRLSLANVEHEEALVKQLRLFLRLDEV
jgi:Fe-S cluster biosynthesis and repair protein YggX